MNSEIDKLYKLKNDYKWIYSNYENIQRYYKNQFIAVKDSKHIDSDINLELLLERLKSVNFTDLVAIDYIHP
ncbi:MAG: hypothetical protein R2685_02735 [Candidatus Nitrosocosmicus sp.]|nr:hypothetical protein [Candidatus Nitrosocosmicus sp.]